MEFGRAVNKIRIVQDGNRLRAYAIGADMYAFGVPPENQKASDSTTPVEVGKP